MDNVVLLKSKHTVYVGKIIDMNFRDNDYLVGNTVTLNNCIELENNTLCGDYTMYNVLLDKCTKAKYIGNYCMIYNVQEVITVNEKIIDYAMQLLE